MSVAERALERWLGPGPYDAEVLLGTGDPEDVYHVHGWVTADGSRGELSLRPGARKAAALHPAWVPPSGDLTVPLPHDEMVRKGVTPSHPLYYAWLLDGTSPESAAELERAQPPFDWAGTVSLARARERHPIRLPGLLQRRRPSWRAWAQAVPVEVRSDGSTVAITVTDSPDGDPEPAKSTAAFSARAGTPAAAN